MRISHRELSVNDSSLRFVFGGWDGKKCLNDLYEFSFTSKIWYNVSLSCVGEVPSPRYRLDACSISNRLYIFGGVDNQQKKYNTLYEFNHHTKQWNNVPVYGSVPSARSFLKLIEVGENIVLFGGVDDKKKNDIYTLELSVSAVVQSSRKSEPSFSLPFDRSMIDAKSVDKYAPVADMLS